MASVEKMTVITAGVLALAGIFYEVGKPPLTSEQKDAAAQREFVMIEGKCAASDEDRMGKQDYDGHSGAFRSACMAYYLSRGASYESNLKEGRRLIGIINGTLSESYHYLQGFYRYR